MAFLDRFALFLVCAHCARSALADGQAIPCLVFSGAALLLAWREWRIES